MIHLLEAGLVFHEWGAGGAILSSLTVELVTCVHRALTRARADGADDIGEMRRAVIALMGRYPEMSACDALDAVSRVRRVLEG